MRALLIAVAAVFTLSTSTAHAGPPTLSEMEAKVRQDYDVSHMSTAELDARLAAGEDLLLIDVRELEEHAVSHLPGAIQVRPNRRRRGFLKDFSAAAAGKTVVFYCSVGVRSSIMAERVQKELIEAGAVQVVNLEGGLFRWHNETAGGQSRSPLVDAGGQTKLIHPYDTFWGQLLTTEDATEVSYTPLPR